MLVFVAVAVALSATAQCERHASFAVRFVNVYAKSLPVRREAAGRFEGYLHLSVDGRLAADGENLEQQWLLARGEGCQCNAYFKRSVQRLPNAASTLYYDSNVAHDRHVSQRVAMYQNDIRVASGREDADILIGAQEARRP